MDAKYKELITGILLKHTKEHEVAIQAVIDELTDIIVNTANNANLNDSKAIWIKRIQSCAGLLNLDIAFQDVNWDAMKKLLHQASSDSTRSQSSLCSKSSLPALKTPFTEDHKVEFDKIYNNLDKSKFLVLSATKKASATKNTQPMSIEETMYNFGKKCKFLHPCHSFILDLNDRNWRDELSQEELDELKSIGVPLVRATPEPLNQALSSIKSMSVKEIYVYAHSIDHDPATDHMLTWLSLTLTHTASMFLCANTGYSSTGDADVMYEKWCLLKSVLRGSELIATGKEITSKANRDSENAKRKLSAVEPIGRAKLGRRMDDIYSSGGVEYGCMEIGHQDDQTKEFYDSHLKLTLVMKDMLLNITDHAPDLIHQTHILGYNITGSKIQQLDMDCPGGYVTRIRRSTPLAYPSSTLDYQARISSILKIVANGLTIMQETQSLYSKYEIPLESETSALVLPRCFTAGSSSESSTSSASSSKKTKIHI